ncbi:ABC transporter ATP-binding protein, partial [Methylobacterium variabile]
MTAIPLLDISDLTVEFATRRGTVQAVRQVDVTVAKGETVGIVGESGSGKSVTSYAVMRILDRAGRIAGGEVSFSGIDLRGAGERQMRDLRGREISMIFQNPRAALNPIRKVGHQIEDVLRQHAEAGSGDARAKAIAALEQVRIARASERYHAYPFELSGGMCQRVVIALALACRPQLLIADEPTTGLDVTTQKAVMDLVTGLTRERGMATVLITHDLGLAATYCDRIAVMEQGRVVETAPAATIFRAPAHAYTRKLMQATPRPGVSLRDLLPPGAPAAPLERAEMAGMPLLTVSGLVKEYPRAKAGLIRRKAAEAPFRAVDSLSFAVNRGESVGLVGESGCGKSTTSTMVMRLLDPTAGSIVFAGEEIGRVPAARFARHRLRPKIQMVFQDPTESLNPRWTAARAIADPLLRFRTVRGGEAIRARCEELARLVGLPVELLDRFPHQLSG